MARKLDSSDGRSLKPRALRLRALNNSRGELLVEGAISFIILLVALAIAFGILTSSVNINNRAMKLIAKTEAAIEQIELVGGSVVGSGLGTITAGGVNYNVNVDVKEVNGIKYFEPR